MNLSCTLAVQIDARMMLAVYFYFCWREWERKKELYHPVEADWEGDDILSKNLWNRSEEIRLPRGSWHSALYLQSQIRIFSSCEDESEHSHRVKIWFLISSRSTVPLLSLRSIRSRKTDRDQEQAKSSHHNSSAAWFLSVVLANDPLVAAYPCLMAHHVLHKKSLNRVGDTFDKRCSNSQHSKTILSLQLIA